MMISPVFYNQICSPSFSVEVMTYCLICYTFLPHLGSFTFSGVKISLVRTLLSSPQSSPNIPLICINIRPWLIDCRTSLGFQAASKQGKDTKAAEEVCRNIISNGLSSVISLWGEHPYPSHVCLITTATLNTCKFNLIHINREPAKTNTPASHGPA